MGDKVVILNSAGQYIAFGTIKFYYNKTGAVITIDKDISSEDVNLSPNEELSLVVNASYYECYLARVDSFNPTSKELSVTALRNDALELTEDIKTEIEHEVNIMCLMDDKLLSKKVTTRDISATGFCFTSSEDLDTEKKYELILSFTNEPLVINFNIIRKIFREEDNKYVYGARFYRLNRREEEIIRKTVYNIMAKRRNATKRSEY